MKTLKTMIVGAGALALLGASGLFAQTRATANIPFEFSAQNTTLPAGEYTMSRPTPGIDLLMIRNEETHKAVLVLAHSNMSEYKGAPGVVVFHQIGDRYFLAEVKTEAINGHVLPSRLERELESEGGGAPAAVIIPALGVR